MKNAIDTHSAALVHVPNADETRLRNYATAQQNSAELCE
jgi:hypothetical protein